MGGANNPEDDYRPPLPKEDRLWRHPSEVAAEQRAAVVSVTTMRTSWKQALGLATVGALGGALVVTGLFLTLAGSNPQIAESEPIVSTLAMDPIVPIVPIVRTVDPDEWVDAVITAVKPGLAQISVPSNEGDRTGSGVLIRSDGVILTSYDLLGDAEEVQVLLADARSFAGRVLGRDRISGLAVVAIENADTPTAPLAIPKPRPDLGDYAVAVSAPTNPMDLVRASITATAVNVPVQPDQDLHGLLQTDGAMPAHGSGGALVDDAGAVIGIVVGTGAENATYAVPIGYARKIAADIIRYGQGMHSWLGIKGVTSATDDNPDTQVNVGVRITSVIETSPADRAQLHKGDVITSIDDVEIVSMTELILELRKHPPDSDVEVRFLREGAPFRVTLTIVGRQVGDTT
ncbi:MAG: S1C family serine protease [Acidimicrobiales bacterium]